MRLQDITNEISDIYCRVNLLASNIIDIKKIIFIIPALRSKDIKLPFYKFNINGTEIEILDDFEDFEKDNMKISEYLKGYIDHNVKFSYKNEDGYRSGFFTIWYKIV